jgi:hypothetical protein
MVQLNKYMTQRYLSTTEECCFRLDPVDATTVQQHSTIIDCRQQLYRAFSSGTLRNVLTVVVLLIFFSEVLQLFVPWPLFSFLNPIHSR